MPPEHSSVYLVALLLLLLFDTSYLLRSPLIALSVGASVVIVDFIGLKRLLATLSVIWLMATGRRLVILHFFTRAP